MSTNPLGQTTEYPQEYAPDVLFPIPRSEGRSALGLETPLPFTGIDIWNAWELTWLDSSGRPVAAIATMRIDAASPNIVESKSLKLYLGSFAMSRFGNAADVARTIGSDLKKTVGKGVEVEIDTDLDNPSRSIDELPGISIDSASCSGTGEDVDPGLLSASGETVTETLHSHLLRSLCPVTGQPDIGSVMIHYRGPCIDRASLLDYIVSYRQHQDFHEACVERIFLDIRNQCAPEELTVYACYNRRGGIDINPFRTDFDDEPPNLRLWRQ